MDALRSRCGVRGWVLLVDRAFRAGTYSGARDAGADDAAIHGRVAHGVLFVGASGGGCDGLVRGGGAGGHAGVFSRIPGFGRRYGRVHRWLCVGGLGCSLAERSLRWDLAFGDGRRGWYDCHPVVRSRVAGDVF